MFPCFNTFICPRVRKLKAFRIAEFSFISLTPSNFDKSKPSRQNTLWPDTTARARKFD